MAFAWALGLLLRPVLQPGASLRGMEVFFDRRVPLTQMQQLVARCVAEHGLRRAGIEPHEVAIAYVAQSITTPDARRQSDVFAISSG